MKHSYRNISTVLQFKNNCQVIRVLYIFQTLGLSQNIIYKYCLSSVSCHFTYMMASLKHMVLIPVKSSSPHFSFVIFPCLPSQQTLSQLHFPLWIYYYIYSHYSLNITMVKQFCLFQVIPYLHIDSLGIYPAVKRKVILHSSFFCSQRYFIAVPQILTIGYITTLQRVLLNICTHIFRLIAKSCQSQSDTFSPYIF